MGNFIEYIYVGNIAACIILGIVLLFAKTTPHPHNQHYLIAKKFIAFSLFLAAIAVMMDLLIGDVNDSKVEMLNIITLIDFNIQIVIFTFALMTLYNSQLVSRKNIYTVLTPLIVLIVAYLVALIIYGDICVFSHDQYLATITQEPALIIRTLMFIWGIISVIICIRWFLKAQQKFNNAIDNYFDGTKELHTRWVGYIFYTSLILAGLVAISYIIILPYFDALSTIGITALFTVISIHFLNYPQTFKVIYPALETSQEITISATQINTIEKKLSSWKSLPTKPYTQEGLTVGALADELKENKRAVSKYLNTQCNANFNTWINTLRIEEAIKLLENNGLPLYEIAERTGFSDLAKMSNFMKRQTGLSPSDYRKKYYTKQ